MVDYNLNELVKSSKEDYKKQGIPIDTKDIYAEFREQNESSNVNPPKIRNEVHIKETPDDIDLENEFVKEPEIEEFDEPIFPQGPLTSQIKSWKKQYDKCDIYAIEVAGVYFVFRTLTRFQYKQIVELANIDALQREEIICEQCTLWPQSYKWDTMATGKAGIPSTYSQIIMQKSGFTQEYSIQVL